jgi:uncharacterized membrane protein YccC
MLRTDTASLWSELAELTQPGPRARICAMTAIAVLLSVLIALALDLDSPWWAGISGYMSMQASGPGSIRKGLLRIVGTIAGAAAGFIITPVLAYDHVAGLFGIFAIALLGSLGSLVSTHGYAWLFLGITTNLVALASMTHPLNALDTAVYRIIEVVVGTSVAMVVATVLAEDDDAAPAPSPAGWSDLLGSGWPAVMHAVRAAIAITLLPIIWSTLNLPSLGQTAITAAAVMAVPTFTGRFQEDMGVVLHRGLLRLLGCFVGGVAALALLAIPLTNFLLWLAVLGGGIWVCAHVQASTRGISYLGIQAALVFLITLVQGQQAPMSLEPGADRMAGITGGLTILLLVTAVIWPDPVPDTATPQED